MKRICRIRRIFIGPSLIDRPSIFLSDILGGRNFLLDSEIRISVCLEENVWKEVINNGSCKKKKENKKQKNGREH